jgi:stalled ribosome rescue protein Dom34
MQSHFHAIIWIDHEQAKVFHVGLTGADQIDLHPHLQTRHIHHKANSIGSGHVHEDKDLMKDVADAVSDAGEILIMGPAAAKTELAKYLREKAPRIGERIVGVEPADHPSDREIVAYAKKHFKTAALRAGTPAGH